MNPTEVAGGPGDETGTSRSRVVIPGVAPVRRDNPSSINKEFQSFYANEMHQPYRTNEQKLKVFEERQLLPFHLMAIKRPIRALQKINNHEAHNGVPVLATMFVRGRAEAGKQSHTQCKRQKDKSVHQSQNEQYGCPVNIKLPPDPGTQ